MSDSTSTTTPQPGDIVNGHILGVDGTWQQIGVVASQPEPRNGLGIAALILGIVGILSGLIPFFFWFALTMGIVALVLGLVARARVKRGTATNKKTAIFGVVTGLGAIAMGIWGMVILFSAVDQLDKDLDQIGADMDAYSECVDAIPADLDVDAYSAALDACDAG